MSILTSTRHHAASLARWVLPSAIVAACGQPGLDVDSSRGGGHKNFDEVELALPGADTVLATWRIGEGWRDALGNSLDALPPSVLAGETLEPLRVGGPPASLQVRLRATDPIDIAPLEAGGEGNPCGEFSARYFPLDDETSVIAWPNVADPDRPEAPALFAARADGELVQIFHCDRFDIYPEQAGRAELEVLLWHVNHADQAADALGVDVLEADGGSGGEGASEGDGGGASEREGEGEDDPAAAAPDASLANCGDGLECSPDGDGLACAGTRYTAGHGDVFARYEDGELSLRLRSHLTFPSPEGPEPEYDPGEICISVPYSSYLAVAADGGRPSSGDPDAFDPIGVPEGAAFWQLSQNNLGMEQPFLGVSTEGIPTEGVFDGELRFDFEPLRMPANAAFSVYQLPFLPAFYVSTSHPEATELGAQRVAIQAGVHDHYFWSFSQPGRYEIAVRVSGELSDGGTVTSPPSTYVFDVEAAP